MADHKLPSTDRNPPSGTVRLPANVAVPVPVWPGVCFVPMMCWPGGFCALPPWPNAAETLAAYSRLMSVAAPAHPMAPSPAHPMAPSPAHPVAPSPPIPHTAPLQPADGHSGSGKVVEEGEASQPGAQVPPSSLQLLAQISTTERVPPIIDTLCDHFRKKKQLRLPHLFKLHHEVFKTNSSICKSAPTNAIKQLGTAVEITQCVRGADESGQRKFSVIGAHHLHKTFLNPHPSSNHYVQFLQLVFHHFLKTERERSSVTGEEWQSFLLATAGIKRPAKLHPNSSRWNQWTMTRVQTESRKNLNGDLMVPLSGLAEAVVRATIPRNLTYRQYCGRRENYTQQLRGRILQADITVEFHKAKETNQRRQYVHLEQLKAELENFQHRESSPKPIEAKYNKKLLELISQDSWAP